MDNILIEIIVLQRISMCIINITNFDPNFSVSQVLLIYGRVVWLVDAEVPYSKESS
jgi:hypothetical protein